MPVQEQHRWPGSAVPDPQGGRPDVDPFEPEPVEDLCCHGNIFTSSGLVGAGDPGARAHADRVPGIDGHDQADQAAISSWLNSAATSWYACAGTWASASSVTASGFARGLALLCQVLRERGARTIARKP